MLRALIWDVDGTVAETERDGHRIAFNQAFEQLGLTWRWDVVHYGELLKVTGGRERLLLDMLTRADAPAEAWQRDQLAGDLHRRKNLAYARLIDEGGIAARPGVLRLVDECRAAGVALAVATTTSRSNVEALFASLWGPGWQGIFTTVVCAEDAPVKKPHPQAYLLALQRLGVAAGEALALEDSPNGLVAARAAGLACGVTKSVYFAHASFDGAAWVRDDLDAPPAMTLAALQATLAGSIEPSRHSSTPAA
ncbi:MAG: haloacid dehalogenase [Leptothrix sp. (in: Bacteria)]|nr:haloacid dehalogenase [Leptothrix sp. (in: b-proteobacteria)]